MSLETVTEIDLDINQPGVSVVHAKQYDTARKVKAHLFYSGVKWMIPESNIVAVISYKKSDRIGGFYDETELGESAVAVDASDRSIAYLLLDRQLLTTVGNVMVELTFYDSVALNRLSTFSFITQVEEASITELDLASNPYFNVLAQDISAVLHAEQNIAGLTATSSKIAPGATPTVDVSGGGDSGVPYNLAFGIPTFAGITVSATGLAEGASPTATVSGGTSGTSKFAIAFGIPKGDKGDPPTPTSVTYEYAVSTSGTVVPTSGWSPSTAPVKGKYFWSKITVTWNNSGTSTSYIVSYIAMDGTGSTASEIIASDSNTVQQHLDTIENDVGTLQTDVGNVESALADHDIMIEIASFSSLPQTVSDSRITADHVVNASELDTPVAQTGDWTVVTSAGSATVSGNISGTTSLKMLLTKAS